MSYRYLGPARNLVVNGKAYMRGDVVPLSEAEARSLAQSSGRHRFEGVDAEGIDFERPGPTVLDQFSSAEQLQNADGTLTSAPSLTKPVVSQPTPSPAS